MNSNKFYAVAVPAIVGNTSDSFLVDVRVYGPLPHQLKTAHPDKSLNYVAFVQFYHKNQQCTLHWNVTEKEPLNEEHWAILGNYIEENEEIIRELAIQKFKETYPSYKICF